MVKGFIEIRNKTVQIKDIDLSELQGGEVLLSKRDKDTFAIVARKMPTNITLRICRVYHYLTGSIIYPTDSFIFSKPEFVKEDWWLAEKAVFVR